MLKCLIVNGCKDEENFLKMKKTGNDTGFGGHNV